ncbi:MAG: quinolinate synthase NadA, partial [Deltaproteobacteria bacterium]
MDKLPVVGHAAPDVDLAERLGDAELEAEIKRLKRERNAVILAHYYQESEIQDLADYVGDSLQLSQAAAKTQADVIAFCGV